MKSFNRFVTEHKENEEYLSGLIFELDEEYEDSGFLIEDYTAKDSSSHGHLHELLTGYHLLGGRHMERHKDKNGLSPKEVHDKIKSEMDPKKYEHINRMAKSAAEHLRKHVEQNGHKIHDVHWTSKPGDIERSTGIKSTQHQDASDIVISTHKNKEKPKYHGVSLKASQSNTKHLPVSNPGVEHTGGTHSEYHHDEHRHDLLRKFPKLKSASNAKERKEMLRNDPKMHEYVKKKNKETLEKIAKNSAEHLNNLPKSHVVEHLRHILHAHQTPMEKEGHSHIRHTTRVDSSGKIHHDIMTPSQHHEHILKDPHNITIHHSGKSVHFKYKGKTFARHDMKFSSESDPLSPIKGSVQTSGE